jgi:3-oxoacyl-[acyl-carrier protein] reductase
MIPRGSGKIVNLASGRGITGMPGYAPYAASKGGVIGLTVTLGIELAPYGINVNAIAPGITDTPGLRSGVSEESIKAAAEWPHNRRLGLPGDVVGPVLFLVTDASRTMYGQIMFLKTP